MLRDRGVAARSAIWTAACALCAEAAADVRLAVSVQDENWTAAPGAQAPAAAGGAARLQALAGPPGKITLELAAPGDYLPGRTEPEERLTAPQEARRLPPPRAGP